MDCINNAPLDPATKIHRIINIILSRWKRRSSGKPGTLTVRITRLGGRWDWCIDIHCGDIQVLCEPQYETRAIGEADTNLVVGFGEEIAKRQRRQIPPLQGRIDSSTRHLSRWFPQLWLTKLYSNRGIHPGIPMKCRPSSHRRQERI